MAKKETIQTFIPANIIEYDTKPEYTLSDKLRNVIIKEIREKEMDPNLYIIVFVQNYSFIADKMGYNVNAQVTTPN